MIPAMQASEQFMNATSVIYIDTLLFSHLKVQRQSKSDVTAFLLTLQSCYNFVKLVDKN